MNQLSAVPFGSSSAYANGYAQAADARLGNVDFVFENTGANSASIQVKELTVANATLSTNLTGTNNDLTFTAVNKGATGDAITVEFIDPGLNNGVEKVVVSGNDIKVFAATGAGGAITSTGDTVRNSIIASGAASALVSVANKAGNDGSGLITAMAKTNLSGGESWVNVGSSHTVVPKGTKTASYVLNSKTVGFFGTATGGTTVNITSVIRNRGDLRGAQIDLLPGGRKGWGYSSGFNPDAVRNNWGPIPDVPSASAV